MARISISEAANRGYAARMTIYRAIKDGRLTTHLEGQKKLLGAYVVSSRWIGALMGQAVVHPGAPPPPLYRPLTRRIMSMPRLYRRRAARLSWRRRLAEDTARRLRDLGHRRAALEVYENDVAAELETLIE